MEANAAHMEYFEQRQKTQAHISSTLIALAIGAAVVLLLVL